MRVSAKAEYAVCAAIELASTGDAPMKRDQIAEAQGIPYKFLENILAEMRHAGLVRSQRGADGGYRLARPPEEITIADIFRAVEGPLASVRGERPEDMQYSGNTEALGAVWVALRASIRSVLEQVSIADIANGDLPDHVKRLIEGPDDWVSRQ